jgi:capsular polysaccharide biosynthesis protein
MTEQTQSTFDLRGVLDTLRLRWWIVLLSIIVAVFAVFIQETNSKAPTDGYLVTVYKTYEAKIETSALQIAQVDPSAVVPFPSFESQLGVLQSGDTATELLARAGVDAVVAVTRSEPKFTMVDTLDEANNRVTFLSRGTTSYTYMCRAANVEDCNKIIDAYVLKTSELRKEGTIGGLEVGQKLISELLMAGEADLNDLRSTGAPATSIAALENKLVDLKTKSDALEFTADEIAGTLEFASEAIIEDGAAASFVKKSSYLYGLIFGLIVGLLIVSQLGITDKKIRSKRQINRGRPSLPVLGDVATGSGLQEGIAAVVASARAHSINLVRVVGLGGESSTLSSFNNEVAKHSLQVAPLPLFSTLTAEALLAPANSAMLLVAVKGVSRIDSLQQAVEAAQLAGNQVLGVLLISAD